MKSVGLPHKNICSFIKMGGGDNLGVGTQVYRQSRLSGGNVYIRQTGRSVDTRLKEHQRNIQLEHPDKSAVTEHSVDSGHCIQLHNTSIFATKIRYMDHTERLSSIPTIQRWWFLHQQVMEVSHLLPQADTCRCML
jgi:hypothetical protein